MNKRNKIFKILIIVLVVFIMTGCEDAKMESYCMRCGADTYFPLGLVNFCAGAVNFIKIIVPTIIVIIGMIDLVRAVIASDDKKMEEAKKGLIRKFIAGIMIFLVIAIVQFVFSLIPDFNGNGSLDVFECMEHFINGYDREDNCPPRTNGKKIPIWDDEEGYTPKDYEKKEINRDGSVSECKSLTGRSACLSTDDEINCSWSDAGYNIGGNTVHCVSTGYNPSKTGCYENVTEPAGERRRVLSESSPGGDWRLTNLSDADCKSEKVVYACYECTEGGIKSYVWDSKSSNSGICKKTSYTKSECHEERCYYCPNSAIRYIWGHSGADGCIELSYMTYSECG